MLSMAICEQTLKNTLDKEYEIKQPICIITVDGVVNNDIITLEYGYKNNVGYVTYSDGSTGTIANIPIKKVCK